MEFDNAYEPSKVPTSLQLSAEFLADLDTVCTQADPCGLATTFLSDLECAYESALIALPREPSIAELDCLAKELVAWRSDTQLRLRSYLDQLRDDDPLCNPISLFGTMDYGRLETAHTRTLAWLLDKKEHGFGFQLLEALLNHLPECEHVRLLGEPTVSSEMPIPCGSRRTDLGRLDVLAYGRWEESGKEVSWLLVIEAKVDADEGEEQLSSYDGWIDDQKTHSRELRVLLTPDGRKPRTGTEWQALSFPDLAGVFRRASLELQHKPGYHFLRYYLTGILKDICKLPLPILVNCSDPYTAAEYLKSVFVTPKSEGAHDDDR